VAVGKFVPVTVMGVDGVPYVALNPEMVGTGAYVKLAEVVDTSKYC
jgi:hypothetical protein